MFNSILVWETGRFVPESDKAAELLRNRYLQPGDIIRHWLCIFLLCFDGS